MDCHFIDSLTFDLGDIMNRHFSDIPMAIGMSEKSPLVSQNLGRPQTTYRGDDQ